MGEERAARGAKQQQQRRRRRRRRRHDTHKRVSRHVLPTAESPSKSTLSWTSKVAAVAGADGAGAAALPVADISDETAITKDPRRA